MSRYLRLLGLVLSLLGLTMTSPAQAAKRVALVVGNDQYDSLPKLQKAVSDARAVGEALKELGFEVIAGENLDRRNMNRKLADLERAIAPGDQVFFFYAGHGVSLGAENYLLPVDMPAPQPGEDGLVRNEGHAADAIIRAIQRRGAGVSFVVLDACRNNPFEASGTRDIGLSRGLSRIDAPAGVFVLFSAGIGQEALDRLSNADADPNSVFTRKLVPLLRTPGLSHVDLAKELQQEVSALAATIKHTQEPAYYDQIIGRVVLKEGEKVVAVEPAAKVEPSALPSEAAAAWAAVKDSGNRAMLEAIVKRFPDSVFADFAAAKLTELEPEIAVLTPTPAPAAQPPGCDNLLVSVGTTVECLKPGDVFRDCPECPEMVVVPAGTFTMGSKDQFRAEAVHEVKIARAFAVARFEVTVDQFAAFVSASGYELEEECWTREQEKLEFRSPRSFRNPGFPQTGNHPATCLNWVDSKAYAKWLSDKTGEAYRLPSEAEWEYAARAGTSSAFGYGDDESLFCKYSNSQDRTAIAARPELYPKTDCEDGFVYSSPVGSFAPNAFGLHDLLGNLKEWVEDCWNDSYEGAPADGSAWTIALDGVCINGQRGGSWENFYASHHVAERGQGAPTDRSWDNGFRVARMLTP